MRATIVAATALIPIPKSAKAAATALPIYNLFRTIPRPL